MSHRIPLGIGGITGFRAASAVARLNCHFWQEYCHFWQEDYLFWQDYCHFANIFCLFWRFAQKNFGFHRVSRISEGFRGFQRVSSAESASRHSSAGYVFEALARWRAKSVGWNTYALPEQRHRRVPRHRLGGLGAVADHRHLEPRMGARHLRQRVTKVRPRPPPDVERRAGRRGGDSQLERVGARLHGADRSRWGSMTPRPSKDLES